MPSASGKGKIPISQVCEYDPSFSAAPGMPREKHQKSTNASMAGRPGKATSTKPGGTRKGTTQRD
jgi:hypothetical protein